MKMPADKAYFLYKKWLKPGCKALGAPDQRQEVSVKFGAKMSLDIREYSQRLIYYCGVYEEPELQCISSYIGTGHVFVDVGANIGYYSLWAASKVGASGKVFSFEPDPITYADLEENVALNQFSNIQLCPIACGEAVGQSFFLHEYDNTGSSHLITDNSVKNETLVSVARLDTYLQERGVTNIDFLKIDAEGAELQVLKGATAYLQLGIPPLVQVEVINKALKQFSSSEKHLVDFMSEHNYLPYDITLDGLQQYIPLKHNANLLFIHKSYQHKKK